MGDRNNPIKFGPEWLRNLARERNAAAPGATNNAGGAGPTLGPGAAGPALAAASTAAGAMPKVLLAKLRYGREEMLALYDRSAEAPPELIYNESLYQPRGKPPIALNNSFEDEMRDPSRSGPPLAGLSVGERFGASRGLGRGSIIEGRGRGRLPFVRQTSIGRGTNWHAINARGSSYNGAGGVAGGGGGVGVAEDELATSQRAWSSTNGSAAATRTADQVEWAQIKMFRPKRPGSNTNWRQSREEDEWRANAESARPRSMQPDKWERDWGDRPLQDKTQPSWNTNRRAWVGGDEENLPEWAVDNAEACGGTFDSSGAFHGYSNDDTNLPKSQDPPYPLTRSHTHGSIGRSKPAEEESDEWRASEKAKKLSPKRFNAIEIKFKKPIPDASSSNSESKTLPGIDSATKAQDKQEELLQPSTSEQAESSAHHEDKFNKKVRFTESKTFDALMRSDINLAEANDERGNFQSVMITPNNSLRQKHQNIVSNQNYITAVNNNAAQPNKKPRVLQILQQKMNQEAAAAAAAATAAAATASALKHPAAKDKVVENIRELTLEDREVKDMYANLPKTSASMVPNPSVSIMGSVINTRSHHLISPTLLNQGVAVPKVSASSDLHAIQSHGVQQLGITNSALNASLGLPLGTPNEPVSRPMGIPLAGVPPPVLPAQSIMHAVGAMPGFPSASGMPGRSNANLNASLFLGQSGTNTQVPPSGDIPMPKPGNQSTMFPLQQSGSQAAFGSSIFSSVLQQPPAMPTQNPQDLGDQWYYEDPKKIIQGPFSARDMFTWYQAGFFTSTLMIRRATDTIMRPLGSYGPVVPFAQMDMLSSFPLSSGFEIRNQGPRDTILNSQQGIGLDVMNMNTMNLNPTEANPIDTMPYGAVGLMRNPSFGQQPMDSLWSQSAPAPDMWLQRPVSGRTDAHVNNLPLYFWDQQPSAMASNSLRPEVITKDMKTEDEILAQLRASQSNTNSSQSLSFLSNTPMTTTVAKEESFPQPNVNIAPDLDELQKLMLEKLPPFAQSIGQSHEPQLHEKDLNTSTATGLNQKPQPSIQDQDVEVKAVKSKVDNEKMKETSSTKSKPTKKSKEDKKEEVNETKGCEDDTNLKVKKQSTEHSPVKPRKEDKINKKELEKEKKEWVKEGFTIVKTPEKSITKENKKKLEEIKMAEEAERRRKEEERLAAEEEKKLKTLETLKKQQQEAQKQQQRQQQESAMRKAPWSAVPNQTLQDTSKDGLTLAEIQRLEREKKLHQMKEQQQMIQIIAQQQAVALAREQEMQAGLGWAKNKGNANMAGQSLAEIQAETRKQSLATATVAAQAQAATALTQDEAAQASPALAPWTTPSNGAGGFWDTQLGAAPAAEPPAVSETSTSKTKKKVQIGLPVKNDPSPSADFENWCLTVLSTWQTQLDVPTFVSFLKDIESPYEVKDYVKFYLGETRDSSDFARQFLERRSKLLRVGMVTPSDDLCSPAVAVNPRTTSTSDYQEVKGKGKKTKKNKMLKVDARILGFSVTAAEDRINVGDIDMA